MSKAMVKVSIFARPVGYLRRFVRSGQMVRTHDTGGQFRSLPCRWYTLATEKIEQNQTSTPIVTYTRRFAMSSSLDYKQGRRYHNLWTGCDVAGRRLGGAPAMEHLMRIDMCPDHSSSATPPQLVAQPSGGLNLMISDGCIRVLDLPRKDLVMLPGISSEDIMKRWSASMEYSDDTGKYKIIQMVYSACWGNIFGNSGWKCYTYTLGANATWVEAASPSRKFKIVDMQPPVFANGAHHWLTHKPFGILAFDANSGSYDFKHLEDNVGTYLSEKMFLDVVSGNLCVMRFLFKDREFLGRCWDRKISPAELWMLEKSVAVGDGTNDDVGSEAGPTWVMKWQGDMPLLADCPFWMEDRKLVSPRRGYALSWYDLDTRKVRIIGKITHCNLPDWGLFRTSMTVYDHELASPEILQEERRIIASTEPMIR